jgi:hypothetical protein
MLLTAWLAWLGTLRFAQRTEVLVFSDARVALACAVTYCLTLWSFAALAGMLGRYRYFVWAATAVAALLAVDVAGMPYSDLPVLRLMGQDVQMASAVPERSAFVIALGIAAACAAGAAVLALAGSGSMAATLAGRMTTRERVFALVAVIVVATIGYSLQPKPTPPPFRITDGEQFEGRWTRVGVLSTPSFDSERAQRLARTIAADADSLIDALALEIHPPVYVQPQQGLDRHVMQRAALGAEDGIVLKVAPNAPIENVRMFVLHSLVSDASRGRAMKEDRHALLDGLAVFWAVRDDEPKRELWWLRAAALPESLGQDELTAWSQTSERFGECESLALAYSVFDTLVQRVGLDAALQSAREIFAPPPENVRVLFERRPAAVLAAAGIGWPQLAAAADDARRAARERHAQALARRPTVTADVAWRSTPGRGIAIDTSVSGAPRYAAYYSALSPWTSDVPDMARLEVLGSSAVLPLSPSRAARVLTVIEVDDEILDCPVRVLGERLELR